jgi:hypothetical protein
MMNTKQVAEKLGVNEKYVRKYKGQFRYHQSYYWGMFNGPEKLIARVKENFPEAVITDNGNHYHDFVGSAPSGSAKDSYLWVTFKLKA